MIPLTFIPAKDSMLFSLYWPDWTGVVYMSASLNYGDKDNGNVTMLKIGFGIAWVLSNTDARLN